MTAPTDISAEIAALRRDVQYLKDRTEILDCIHRHARGCDRHDIDLISSTYHQDGADEHGNVVNPGPDYGAWANSVHSASSLVHTHNITTHTCEIDGDTAHAESYVNVILLGIDGRSAQFISGRYLDRLQRRDGGWRIVVRRSTVEVMFAADASVLQTSFFQQLGYMKGSRDRQDPSYRRPLTMDTPAERW